MIEDTEFFKAIFLGGQLKIFESILKLKKALDEIRSKIDPISS